jgi:hypothetical protein
MADENREGKVRSGDGSGIFEPTSSEAHRNYGTAEVSVSGVDVTQLRRNLRLTPAERVDQMVAFVRIVLPLQGIARRGQR